MTGAPTYTIVVPTLARPSLARLLDALWSGSGRRPARTIVVDDRLGDGSGDGSTTLAPQALAARASGAHPAVRVLSTGGRGPAAARNAGWRAATTAWVVFLDDDVLTAPDWAEQLEADLDQPADVAGSQGRLDVPLPGNRQPTDWERGTAALAAARWITADIAYRRDVLELVGGFDERFPRAFREDSDLALRVADAGYTIVRGTRRVAHPVRPAGPWASVRAQRGNADDVLMWALHGPGWRARADAGPRRTGRHLLTVAAAALTAGGALAGRRRLASAAALGWAAGTAELAWCRIAPGPRDRREVATMLATSAVLPVAATAHRAWGLALLPWRLGDTARAPRPRAVARDDERRVPRAVLFDRDGTLVEDVPYNATPAAVRPVPGASDALGRLRRAGVHVGVVTNQSGVARGLVSPESLAAVHERIEQLLGPFDTWQVCCHGPDDRCGCRKPAPGLVLRAAAALGVAPHECAVVGDIGADVAAATAAGARAVLVPTPATHPDDVAASPACAADLARAVDLLIGADGGSPR